MDTLTVCTILLVVLTVLLVVINAATLIATLSH